MEKILVIGTGGTIACRRAESVQLSSAFLVCDYVEDKSVELVCKSPFFTLSEHMNITLVYQLIEFVEKSLEEYDKIIILHGSDTLAYTAAFISNYFHGRAIVLVASNKPIDEKGANGIDNFNNAVSYLKNGGSDVVVSYDGIFDAGKIVSANDKDCFIEIDGNSDFIQSPEMTDKNVLVIKSYIGINYNNYNIDGVDVVLHDMYHSATAPKGAKDFCDKCRKNGVKFYFVTSKASADYESAQSLDGIIFNSTLENAYAKIMLTK